jgi:hypothetical protein
VLGRPTAGVRPVGVITGSAKEGFGVRKPKVDRKYILVRVTGDHIEQAEYTRFADDSVYIEAEGYSTIIEFSPGEWEPAWADLETRGFIELDEARAAGLLPLGWSADAEPGAAPDPAT